MQDLLAGEDTEMGGLSGGGGDPSADGDITVLRAAAAGTHACCLLSARRLRLMALEEGDEREAELMVALADDEEGGGGSAYGDSEGGGGGLSGSGVEWEDVEAMCMFGVRVSLKKKFKCLFMRDTVSFRLDFFFFFQVCRRIFFSFLVVKTKMP